ncbi:MAG: malectin domain-containing carbohydrate-binding protein [Bacteroidota bacterium]
METQKSKNHIVALISLVILSLFCHQSLAREMAKSSIGSYEVKIAASEPRIEFRGTWLPYENELLRLGEKKDYRYVIKNIGGGSLDYAIDIISTHGTDMFSLSKTTGSLKTGEVDTIWVDYDVDLLRTGRHDGHFVVRSNSQYSSNAFRYYSIKVKDVLYRINAGYWKDVPDDPMPWSEDSKNNPSPFVNAHEIGFSTASAELMYGYNALASKSRVNNSNHNMEWDFPVAVNGNYSVLLIFAESQNTSYELGERVFDVEMEGKKVLDDFDIISFAGKGFRAFIRFDIMVFDGNLDIDFINNRGAALISAIEIESFGSEPANNIPVNYHQVDFHEPLWVMEGTELRLPLRGSDLDGDSIYFDVALDYELMEFTTVIDNGDGTGEIIMSPDYGDATEIGYELYFGYNLLDPIMDYYDGHLVFGRLEVGKAFFGTSLYRVNSGGQSYLGWREDTQSNSSNYVNNEDFEFITKSFSGGFANNTDAPDFIFEKTRVNTSQKDMKWSFPMKDGMYMVNLYFIDKDMKLGQRIFDVDIEGQPTLVNFDIFSEVGNGRAVKKTFQTAVTDGNLNIDFRAIKSKALISGINIQYAGPIQSNQAVASAYELEKNLFVDNVPLNEAEISPNPLGSNLEVRLPYENSGEVKVTIVDTSGRIHFEGLQNSLYATKQHTFDLSNTDLTPGVYLVKIETEEAGSWLVKALKR